MSESATRSRWLGRRWLSVGVVLAAVAATAGIVIATRNGSKTKEPPVFLVLAHATVQVGSPDAVWIVNKGAHAAINDGCSGPNVTPRTSDDFRRPNDLFCLAREIDPRSQQHSRYRVATLRPAKPGKYWVWYDYFGYGPHGDLGATAYAKLTVLGPR